MRAKALRRWFRKLSPADWQRALILREILGPPVALRPRWPAPPLGGEERKAGR